MAAAEGDAAETAGKRTDAALTAELRQTATALGVGAGWRPIANAQKATFAAFAKLR
jgi:hypothetical protein